MHINFPNILIQLFLPYLFDYFHIENIFHSIYRVLRVAESVGVSGQHKCSPSERSRYLADVCVERGWSDGFDKDDVQNYWRILVDDKHRVLYCSIPKVACTTFKTFVLNSATGLNDTEFAVHKVKLLKKIGFKLLNEFAIEDIEYRLANYYKFIIVRHPFDRLVSAYLDKFSNSDHLFCRSRSKLIKELLEDNVTIEENGRVRLEFEQFVELIARFYDTRFSERHWQSYFELCHPCNIKYDNIIKLETLSEDLPILLANYFKSDPSGESTVVSTHKTRPDNVNKLIDTTSRFSSVDKNVVQKLLSLYEKDLLLFGYTWNDTAGAGCRHLSCETGEYCS